MSGRPAELARHLLDWYRQARRDLPWRGIKDPYRIWVSEVMLQQTRVETVVPYYRRFLGRFPDLAALAEAPEEEVLANWAGLGYYRRARMLHRAARRVASEHGGQWPEEHAAIRDLPGIGEYTAAAIASIAFDQPRVALDGNAWRVLARLADEGRDIRRAPARRALTALAESQMATVPPGQRGAYTQALMELGAVVCVPKRPRCLECPWAASCLGFAAGTAADLPVKGARRAPRRAAISIAVALRGDCVLLRRRPPQSSVMPGFWELPNVQGPPERLGEIGGIRPDLRRCLGEFSHAITNTRYSCRAYQATAAEPAGSEERWVPRADLARLPLSTISRKALALIPGTPGSGEG